MMNDIIISTESSADLPEQILKEYGIEVCPMDYLVDGKEYNTKTNHMPAKEFYGKMRNGADVKTTQVNLQNATEFFGELLQKGKDILHISLSSGLSGTYQNLKTAGDELSKKSKNKIVVVDSLCASVGQGLLAIEVAKKAQEDGMIVEKLAEFANQFKMKINHIFTVDDLKYLVKGGRVSKTSAFLAGVLRIKPLMKMDDQGKLAVTNKIFSRRLTIKKMAEKMMSNYDAHFNDIFICEADCKDDAEQLAKLVEEQFGLKPTIVPLNYYIGSHAGPGTMSLFYVGDKR